MRTGGARGPDRGRDATFRVGAGRVGGGGRRGGCGRRGGRAAALATFLPSFSFSFSLFFCRHFPAVPRGVGVRARERSVGPAGRSGPRGAARRPGTCARTARQRGPARPARPPGLWEAGGRPAGVPPSPRGPPGPPRTCVSRCGLDLGHQPPVATGRDLSVLGQKRGVRSGPPPGSSAPSAPCAAPNPRSSAPLGPAGCREGAASGNPRGSPLPTCRVSHDLGLRGAPAAPGSQGPAPTP